MRPVNSTVVSLALLACASPLLAQHVETSVDIQPSGANQMMSRAQATYFDQAGMTVPWYIGGDHKIINQNSGAWQAGETINTQEGTWIGTLSGIPAPSTTATTRESRHTR
jgi:hypothetical protein